MYACLTFDIPIFPSDYISFWVFAATACNHHMVRFREALVLARLRSSPVNKTLYRLFNLWLIGILFCCQHSVRDTSIGRPAFGRGLTFDSIEEYKKKIDEPFVFSCFDFSKHKIVCNCSLILVSEKCEIPIDG